jgi:hypothetical protein
VSKLELILEDLKTLPAPKLEEAADYIHRLREASRAERLAVIERSFKILTEAEGAELDKVITEGCEKVDARDWQRPA